MVGTKLQLILFSPDSTLLGKSKPHSVALPYISYEVGYGPQVAATAYLDAFWVTLMGSVELFGAAPPFPLHEARAFHAYEKHPWEGLTPTTPDHSRGKQKPPAARATAAPG